jgi:hypothetical protein
MPENPLLHLAMFRAAPIWQIARRRMVNYGYPEAFHAMLCAAASGYHQKPLILKKKTLNGACARAPGS